jgi:hypothetical protein
MNNDCFSFRRATRGDDGSLVLALLAVMLITAFITLLLGTAFAGQRAARFDRDFTLAAQAADAGAQQALFRLNAVQPTTAIGGSIPSATTFYSGSVGGMTYQWRGTRVSEREWRVDSTGTANGKSRTVRAMIKQQRLYFAGLFADSEIKFTGGNRAYSYNSATHQWFTGRGIIASNGTPLPNTTTPTMISFQGGAHVDKTELYSFPQPDPVGLLAQRCGGAEGPSFCPQAERIPLSRSLTGAKSQIEEKCPQPATSYPDVTITPNTGQTLTPGAGSTPAGTITARASTMQPGVYCFRSLNFDKDNGAQGSESVDFPFARTAAYPNNAIEIYVKGDINALRSGMRVNCPAAACPSGGGGNPFPSNSVRPNPSAPSAGLRLFTTGNVGLQTGMNLAAGIQAPNGTCNGGSNTQIYGAMICRTFTNNGGWTFYYDDALELPGNRVFGISRYSELKKGES